MEPPYSGAFSSIIFGKTLGLRSDGTFKRDYIFIEDAVNAYLTLAEQVVKQKLYGEAFNFGNDTPLSVSQVLKGIATLAPSLRFEFLNTARNEVQEQFLDSSKARRLLKWRPETTLKEGLRKSYEWYSELLG